MGDTEKTGFYYGFKYPITEKLLFFGVYCIIEIPKGQRANGVSCGTVYPPLLEMVFKK